jgi:hypothetical protein
MVNKIASHGPQRPFGYGGPCAFVQITRDTAAPTAIDLGFSFEGDVLLLPIKYASWIVELGDGRFVRARGQLRTREQIEQASA